MKRIAHIVSTFPPYGGGMGNVAYHMVSELGKQGNTVQVITPDYDKQQSDDVKQQTLDAEVKRVTPKFQFGNAAVLTNINKQLDDCDVVHLHFPFYGASNIVRRWKKRNPKKLLVITYHMDSISVGWKGIIFDLYAKWFTPKIFASADIITVSSIDYILNSKAKEYFLKDKSKWVELPFGVDIERFVPGDAKKEILQKHGLDQNIPTCTFVGGMDSAHYFKGVDVFLDAIAMLKSMNILVQGLMVGSGNLQNLFKAKAKKLEIDKLISFAGFVPDDKLCDYYQAGDVSVLPSINQGEAFGIVLLESMASGTPIIASNLPGVRVLAQKGGKTVQPKSVISLASALKSISQQKKFWKNKKQEVRNIVEKEYTWDIVGASLEKIYSDWFLNEKNNKN